MTAWHAGPVTVRRPQARAASVVVVLGSTLLGSAGVGSATTEPTPTCDWPLDCPATVVQRYSNPNLVIDVRYEVVIDETAIPDVIAVEFGPFHCRRVLRRRRRWRLGYTDDHHDSFRLVVDRSLAIPPGRRIGRR
jgi:hypothetical protein